MGAQDGSHLNGVVDKLASGERVYGVSTYDLSLENARSLARADIDYVYVDMEHGPMDFTALHRFLLGMIDKQAIAETGSLRARVAPLVRIAPYGRESSAWAVKQALDIGLMGIIFRQLSRQNKPETRFVPCAIHRAERHVTLSLAVCAGPVRPSRIGFGDCQVPSIFSARIRGLSIRMGTSSHS